MNPRRPTWRNFFTTPDGRPKWTLFVAFGAILPLAFTFVSVNLTHSFFLDDRLSEAATNGDVALMRVYLDKGADPNSTLNDEPVLFSAIQSKNPRAVQLLLERGARVNGTSFLGHSPIDESATMPEIHALLVAAEREGKKAP